MLTGTTLPILLALLGLVAAVSAYRGIMRGSARYYSLERDVLLRRSRYTLLAALFLFAASIALLAYGNRTLQVTLDGGGELSAAEVDAADSAETVTNPSPNATATPPQVDAAAPTLAPIPSPTPTEPPSPTPFIRRGIIEGTGGSGAYLRDGPGVIYQDVLILDENDIVTLVDEEDPVQADNFTWYKVRTVSGTEGWVVDIYMTIRDR